MYLEVSRALTEYFNDPTLGVVACLAAIPRDPGDPLPVVGTIADATTNNLVAQKRFPSVPGIAVNVRQVPLQDGENNTVTGDGIADVVVRIARADVDTKDALRDTSYILRALLQCWRGFNSQSRTRNGVQMYDCQKLIVAPDWTTVDDVTTTGAANAQMSFRDLIATQ